ncbi:dTDP-4-dehydrorhamnose 3,5-epimerase [Sphingopyxis sp. BSNA05]|uniref:dTDP-4-dehydrorhamnose 3,5-epimerase n=1 Tax=Sphingopyxis sp. BSNA05 TaxID=1236614 RepID=UPI00156380EA|nr:dTDP-4-dehydrorhamnose 3,5-epimerase [Sphingopyxis sp. BSNA05]NRD89675.1 dTDP-4-dehydrorhamnose 3,5-epimerase [Sphingopyxis sp. BSNA05]
MRLVDTSIADIKIIEPEVFGDDRGFFYESWNEARFAELGLELKFVQDNHSRSAKGVLRGLHYQIQKPQGKLVRVVAGSIYDVVIDLRKSSPTFGKWEGFTLSEENRNLLWVPPGFAHGFLSLEDRTEVLYRCTDFYAPEHERSLLWNDAELGIDWPLDGEPLLSDKDAAAVAFAQAETFI